MFKSNSILKLLFLAAFYSLISACSLFVGSQRVEHKSARYDYYKLNRELPGQWNLIREDFSDSAKHDTADVSYEHSHAGTIISLTSTCSPGFQTPIKEMTAALFMGVSDGDKIKTREFKLDGVTAIESNLEKKRDSGKIVKIRTVVLQKSNCTYDFMYLSDHKTFEKYVKDFELFLKGFHAN